jgi:hypothetical protein
MGSWVRTITTPFRKMLNPQREEHGGKKASSRHRTAAHHLVINDHHLLSPGPVLV